VRRERTRGVRAQEGSIHPWPTGYPDPNNPVERTAHSAGSVPLRGSVPVGRRSLGALGHFERMEIARRKFVCPCCGYPELDCAPYERMGLPPWLNHSSPPYHDRYGFASFDCCACCGFEFGFDDDPGASATASSFADYLADWIARGCIWFTPSRRPEGWSLEEQLRRAGIQYDKPVAEPL
jgi:hypothetical protein